MATLFRKSLAAFLPAVLAVFLIFLVFALWAMDHYYGVVMDESLGSSAAALVSLLPDEGRADWLLAPDPRAEAWARKLDASSGLRITLMRTDGVVTADSRADAAGMENHGTRPEMRSALSGATGFARRDSVTLDRELFYAARPIVVAGEVVGVLRVAVDLPSLRSRLMPARNLLLGVVVAVALIAAVAAAAFSRGVTLPLRRLAETARRVGRGGGTAAGSVDGARRELRLAATGSGTEELKTLAASLASMVEEIEGRNRAELLAGRERAAILDGMSEAVLALDGQLRIRVANRAARLLFGMAAEGSTTPIPLLEATRAVELAAFAEDCASRGSPLGRELALYREGGERWFQVYATPLGDSDAVSAAPLAREGLVLVLNDITRLRRLERVRTDFVANVSHELRTPIQIVKGFAEALRDGALDDAARAARYVAIIERNATRMEGLIGDLLSLARLEQEGGEGLETKEEDIASLASEAVDAVAPKAEARDMRFAIDIEAGLRARVNAGLFVQALVNLIDNAVKYAPPGTTIAVAARREERLEGQEGGGLLLEVRDRGPGIPARDLPRLFERFYTVDKARSRELGGTGLGLAIVRHVALAHGGQAGAESWEGEGSRFWLSFPG
jgi:two-component system phosphate regulon sensor histidine kinase PhoR